MNKKIEKKGFNKSLILMDDGLQNNSIYQDLKICIFDGSMGLGNSRILPSGPLRESLILGLKKTNIAIIIGEDKNNIQQTILKNINIEIIEIIIALVTEANITAKVTSAADNGAPIKSMIVPIIFPIKREEEECEKAC